MSLITDNIQHIDTLCDLVERLEPIQYQRTFALPHSPSIGRHMRHVIEHYTQLLQGKDEGSINYAARARDPLLEQCPQHAVQALSHIRQQLEAIVSPFAYPLVLHTPHYRVATNLARELDYVYSHSIHHLAIINILLQFAGLELLAGADIHPTTREQAFVCAL